jgi:hypothetical protein
MLGGRWDYGTELRRNVQIDLGVKYYIISS